MKPFTQSDINLIGLKTRYIQFFKVENREADGE